MPVAKPNLFTRPDTFFGVCEAIGEDCGFDPTWLRIALGATVLWNPVAAVVAYLALGVIVLLSRLLMPSRPADAGAEAEAADLPAADNDEAPLAVAA